MELFNVSLFQSQKIRDCNPRNEEREAGNEGALMQKGNLSESFVYKILRPWEYVDWKSKPSFS